MANKKGTWYSDDAVYLYWIHDDKCVCPQRHGYVGITKNLHGRFKGHSKRFPGAKQKVLFSGSRFECMKAEYLLRPDPFVGWNRARGGQKSMPMSEAAKEKVRAAKLGIPRPEEMKERIRLKLRGRKVHTEESKRELSSRMKGNCFHSNVSDEGREKIRQAQLGRKHTPEHIAKAANARRGQKRSEETKEKMRKAQMGHGFSEEARAKMRAAAKKRIRQPTSEAQKKKLSAIFKGRKFSDETRKKMSASAKLRRSKAA